MKFSYFLFVIIFSNATFSDELIDVEKISLENIDKTPCTVDGKVDPISNILLVEFSCPQKLENFILISAGSTIFKSENEYYRFLVNDFNNTENNDEFKNVRISVDFGEEQTVNFVSAFFRYRCINSGCK